MPRFRPLQVVIVVALLVSSMIAAAPSDADHSVRSLSAATVSGGLEPVGSLGGIVQAIAISRNYAYLGVGRSLHIIDISNPAQSVFHSRLDLSDVVQDLTVTGGMAYIANGNAGLQMIDVSSASSPYVRGIYDPPPYFYAESIRVIGNSAYVVSSSGLRILDISNPISPTVLGNLNFSGYGMKLQVANGFAYIASGSTGLRIIDVSNPSNPQLRSTFATPGTAQGVQVVGNLAYVADFSAGVQIIDVTVPTAPTLKGSYDTTGFASGIAIVGNFAYVADSFVDGLVMLDVSNPSSPFLRGSYNTRGEATDLKVVGNLAYIADGSSGLQIVNVANANTLVYVGSYDTPGSPWGLDVVGNSAYLANYESGLYLIDISNPANPRLQGSFDTPYEAFGVHTVGNYAYVADDGGMQIVDVSNPLNPVGRGWLYIPYGDTDRVQVVGNLAYLASGNAGLQIVDVSNPSSPFVRGSYTTNGNVMDAKIVGNRAYLAVWGIPAFELQIVDVSNPSAVSMISQIAVGDSPPEQIYVSGNYAYFAAEGLNIIDISNPISPTIVATYTNNSARSVQVVGNLAYAGGYSVDVLDVTNPGAPVQLASYYDCTDVKDIRIVNQLVYMVCPYDGFQIARVHPENFNKQATITPSGGSLINYDNSLSLTFPANAVTSTTSIFYSGFTAPLYPLPANTNSVRNFSIVARDISTTQVITGFMQPYTMVISYTDFQLASAAIIESSLNAAYWNGSMWVYMLPCAGCGLDLVNNWMTIVADHLTVFTLLGNTHRVYLPLVRR